MALSLCTWITRCKSFMQSKATIFSWTRNGPQPEKQRTPHAGCNQFPESFIASGMFRITELTQMFQPQEELCDHLTCYLSPKASTKMSSKESHRNQADGKRRRYEPRHNFYTACSSSTSSSSDWIKEMEGGSLSRVGKTEILNKYLCSKACYPPTPAATIAKPLLSGGTPLSSSSLSIESTTAPNGGELWDCPVTPHLYPYISASTFPPNLSCLRNPLPNFPHRAIWHPLWLNPPRPAQRSLTGQPANWLPAYFFRLQPLHTILLWD